MKIISKRARKIQEESGPIPGLEVTEVFSSSIIIVSGNGGAIMSPDDIKRAEDIFREIRRQLGDLDITISG